MKKILITCSLIILTLVLFGQSNINTDRWKLVDTITYPNYDDLSAVAFNGTDIYLTEWNSDRFIKSDLSGNIIEEFNIAGISGIRDLCFDGQYFYGGRTDSVIYILDLDNKVLVGEITAPAGIEVRSIAYDPTHDAFWTGNWAKDFYLIDRNGNILDTTAYQKHNQEGISGLAMDNTSHKGPYFWFLSGKPKNPAYLGNLIHTGHFTGLGKELSSGVGTGIASPRGRGLGIFPVSGPTYQLYLMGVIEGSPSRVFIYDLTTMVTPVDIAITSVVSPQHSCELTSNERITIRLSNTGSDTVNNIPVVLKMIHPTYYIHNETVTDVIPPYSSIDYELSKSFYMASHTTYSFEIYSDKNTDLYRENDTLHHDIVSIAPATSPYANKLDSSQELLGWSVFDANDDGYSWGHENNSGFNSSGSYVYSWNPDGVTSANDWLFSPCIELDSSRQYALKFMAKTGLSDYDEMLEIYIGTKPDTAFMWQLLKKSGKLDLDSFVVISEDFEVYASDDYYLAFHVCSDPNAHKLYIDNISIDESVSVDEHRQVALEVYPNPSAGTVQVESDKPIRRLRLVNLSGQCVMEELPDKRNLDFNISSLAPGIYLLQLDFDNFSITRKLTRK